MNKKPGIIQHKTGIITFLSILAMLPVACSMPAVVVMDSYEDQFNLDGSRPDFILQAGPVKKLRHSIGLVSTAATASLVNKEKASTDFVHAIWNAKLEPYEDGYFDPYYDGLMYLFSLMLLSGKYQLIKPTNQ